MNKLLFLSLALFSLLSHAQSAFFKTYGKPQHDYGYCVTGANDGGYLLSGISNGYGGTNYLFLVKTNAAGDTTWTHAYVTTNTTHGYSLVQCADSGYAICGNLGFARIDKNGNSMWNYQFSAAVLNSLQATSDGGFILAGSIASSSKDIFLMKTDPNGVKQWSRKLGGTVDEYATRILQLTDGGYMLVGATDSYGAGGYDILVCRLHSNGDTLWTRTYGGASTDGGTIGIRPAIQRTFDGGYIISAYSSSFVTAGGTDAYAIRTDSSGNILWSKLYGGSGADYFYDVKQCSDSGFVFVGSSTSFGATPGTQDIYVVRTNSNGDTLFTRVFGGALADNAQSVITTNDKGFLLAGYTNSYFGAGNNDPYLLKLDSLGNGACVQYNTTTAVSSVGTQTGYAPMGKVFLTLSTPMTVPAQKSGALAYDACALVEVEEMKRGNFAFYPNPAEDYVFLEIPNENNATIEICDLLGTVVFQEKVIGKRRRVELSSLCSGTYMLHLCTGDTRLIEKLVICK